MLLFALPYLTSSADAQMVERASIFFQDVLDILFMWGEGKREEREREEREDEEESREIEYREEMNKGTRKSVAHAC